MSSTLADSTFDLSDIVANLVTEDDEPVDNILSEKQQRLLTETLYSSWTPPPADEETAAAPRPFWASANVGVFASVHQPPLVPDVFISLDVVPPADMHAKTGRSYLAWEQGKMPDVAVEIVSNREGRELDSKLRDYARIGVKHYVVFDPFLLLSKDVLRVYEPGLAGRYYLRPDYSLPLVQLSLTLWAGNFEGQEYHQWLRWCDADENLLPTPDERAAQAKERAIQAEEKATQAEEKATQAEEKATQAEEKATQAEEKATLADERAARLAAKLRELGVDPDTI
jgi:hypothetical protein